MTSREVIKAIENSIVHWKHMIEWAKERAKHSAMFNPYEMSAAIGENWYDDSCSLCQLFEYCNFCPLGQDTPEAPGIYGCCYEWRDVDSSETPTEWVENAEILLKRLNRELEKANAKSPDKRSG